MPSIIAPPVSAPNSNVTDLSGDLLVGHHNLVLGGGAGSDQGRADQGRSNGQAAASVQAQRKPVTEPASTLEPTIVTSSATPIAAEIWQFNQIARNAGAPRDRLAARLRDLVEAGVLERRAYRESPHGEGYHLTRAGRDLAPVTSALLTWGDKWAVTDPPMRLRHHDHAFRPATTCATCGERVQEGDVTREVITPGWTIEGPA